MLIEQQSYSTEGGWSAGTATEGWIKGICQKHLRIFRLQWKAQDVQNTNRTKGTDGVLNMA